MTYFQPETVNRWRALVDQWLSNNAIDVSRFDVGTGQTAWALAHNAGIMREAYADRKATDGHIQTALETIFPNAKFKDKKVY